MKKIIVLLIVAVLSVMCASHVTAKPDFSLESAKKEFAQPPESARPWVYWFWLNSNITREGITADLEAMKRVGIGGVLIMEVDQGAPKGPVAFMSPQWREMFQFVVSEAQRLGLEVNMNNDAGWNGSGGPWIQPSQSMQKVVWSETTLEGSKKFEGTLAKPETVAGYYRDITVLAFPTPGNFRIDNIKGKAAYERQNITPAGEQKLAPEMVIDQSKIIDLSTKMDKDGHLAWDVPDGKWTVMRFGHTSTGVTNAPSPESGRGLECDKLSKEGIEAQFSNMMELLISDNKQAAGKTLVTTHIDSWENGSQNWTSAMREEFKKRRGYDPLLFLPVMSGKVINSLEISERFLWDLRQTITDMLVEYYAGHQRKLAEKYGLRLSIEAYGGPCDDMTYAGQADEPMSEFWIGGGAFETCKEMASAAHIYGKNILGAESFTAADQEKWLQHPGSIKSLGDRAFCEGVNRFVFHRYAMQPWLNYKPGMTMGPWGLHYERTNTWWEQSLPWHEYLARCQYLLRQGLFTADICYLQPEESPQGFTAHSRKGYDYDNCTAEAVLTRMTVKDGRIVLPDGMNYRVLALPDSKTMTPQLLRKIKDLVRDGATVVGPRPVKSPSLANYPKCDEEIVQLANELWSDCNGTTVKERAFGKGKIIWGLQPEEILAKESIPQDFTSVSFIRWIHRTAGEQDIYFVANTAPQAQEVNCTFRVSGKVPELWNPETGATEPVTVYEQTGGTLRMPIRLESSGSVFVVFSPDKPAFDPIVNATHNNQSLLPASEMKKNAVIEKAVYGVLNDPARTRDVKAKLQALIDRGEYSFTVSRMADGDDPAFMVVKTLVVDYSVEGKKLKVSGQDPEEINLLTAISKECAAAFYHTPDNQVFAEAWQPGLYELKTASGKTLRGETPQMPQPAEITGSWELHFPEKSGAQEKIVLDKLISWSEHKETGVKHFSGTAVYKKEIDVNAEMIGKNKQLYLDLGNVQVMAQVILNGKDLGILWKLPYRVDITDCVKAGKNALEIKVVNLWPNRMIGDEQLPEDSERNPDGTLKAWPQWVLDNKPSPTDRFTFTSWRLWKKGDALLESGLLGPVRLVPACKVLLKTAM